MNEPLPYEEIEAIVSFLMRLINDGLMKNDTTLEDDAILIYYQASYLSLGHARDLLIEKSKMQNKKDV